MQATRGAYVSGIAAFVDRELNKRGWDWRRLSQETGLAESTFSKWKKQPNTIPDLPTLSLVSAKLEVPLYQLVEACGFALDESADYRDLQARARALIASVPELAVIVDRVAGLNPRDQLAVMAVLEPLIAQLQQE